MTKRIPLTQGKVALVSDHRFEYLSQWKWTAIQARDDKWYAMRVEGHPVQRGILMHRAIMGVTDPKVEIDHRDHNGLNNTDENLRACTRAQNFWNKGITKRNSTGFKGVSRFAATGKFRAQISTNKKTIHLGYFDTAEAAAREYDRAAKQLHGEFAYLNFS